MFKPGYRLFLYSDALTENPNAKGERLGKKGLLPLVKQAFKTPDLKEGMRELTNRFFTFAPPPPQDDITIVFIEGQSLEGRETA